MKKRASMILAALCLMLAGTGMTAWAADTKIETVEIEFSWDAEPTAGEEPGNISAEAKGSQYRVTETYFNEDVEVWRLGDTPEATVILYASSGYQFGYTSKSHFRLSGCDAKFKKARYYDDRSTMELTVTFPQLLGKLAPVENLYWSDQDAIWDEMPGAKSYEVRLYRDDRLVTTKETTSTSYNFSGEFTKEGDYFFKVRGIASYNGRAGEWSEASDYLAISGWEAHTTGRGGWIQDNRGWWYSYSSGGYPANGWYEIEGAWYYFNREGYILTGWQQLGNKWYYLGTNGVMTTGWQMVNGRWYYMNGSGEMLTGWQDVGGRRYFLDGSGAMLTGWQQLGGNWYYFDASGAMLTNTHTPDGYYVDYSGVYRP